MTMPPLPPAGHTRPSYIYNSDNEICGHALPVLYYTADQMREYGQACRAAALEEVIALFQEHYTLTTREVVSQIRNLK